MRLEGKRVTIIEVDPPVLPEKPKPRTRRSKRPVKIQ